MISFSILACTIGSQVGPNKMAATINVSLALPSEQWKLDPVFFWRSVVFSAPPPCYKKDQGGTPMDWHKSTKWPTPPNKISRVSRS